MKLLNFLQDLSSKMKSIMLDSSGDDSKIKNIVEPEIVESNEPPILGVNDDLNKQVNGTVGEMNIRSWDNEKFGNAIITASELIDSHYDYFEKLSQNEVFENDFLGDIMSALSNDKKELSMFDI